MPSPLFTRVRPEQRYQLLAAEPAVARRREYRKEGQRTLLRRRATERTSTVNGQIDRPERA